MHRKLKATSAARPPNLLRQDTHRSQPPSSLARYPCCPGFTLTEVVIASALLIVAIVPILKALTGAHATSTIIEHRTRSLTLARAELDEIRARSIYDYSADYTQTSASLAGSYLCNVQDISRGTDLRQIQVAVGYDLNNSGTLDADEIEVTLTTLIARRW